MNALSAPTPWKFAALPLFLLPLLPFAPHGAAPLAAAATATSIAATAASVSPAGAGGSCKAPEPTPALESLTAPASPAADGHSAAWRRQAEADGCRDTETAPARR